MHAGLIGMAIAHYGPRPGELKICGHLKCATEQVQSMMIIY